MSRNSRIVLPMIAALGLLLCACAGSKNTGRNGSRNGLRSERQPSVSTITFSGNTAFPADSLLPLMIIHPPGFLSKSDYQPDIFAADLQNIIAFYQNHGFLDAAIADTHLVRHPTENTVDIQIGIREGGRTYLENLSVSGNKLFPDSLLLKQVGLNSGDPFLRERVQTGMVSIIAMYADSGYLDATIVPEISTQQYRAVVRLVVIERRQRIVSEIRVTGLEKTRDYLVRRELSFHEGEVIQYSRLLESQRDLYRTGVFQSVFVRPLPAVDSLSAGTIIRIQVKEKMSGEFNAAIGYGSVEKVMGRLEVINANLFGTGRRVSLMTEANFIRQGIEGTWTEPWTFGVHLQTDINPFFQYLIEPSYELRRYGGIITVGKSFGLSARLATSFRYQDATLIKVQTTEPPQDFKPSVRTIGLSYTDDTRDDLFETTDGYFLEMSGEVAGSFLQGRNTFVRTIGRIRKFYSPNKSTVLASSFQIGWMDYFGLSQTIPINERFFAGGPISIRGFGYQQAGPLDVNGTPLGGQFMIVWNAIEARRTIYKIVGGAAFVDVGNVWPRIRDFVVKDIRVGAGLGLRVNTPVGIVRVDYGINVDPHELEPRSLFYFSMGQAF